VVLPFVGAGGKGRPSDHKPPGMHDPDNAQLLFIGGDNPVVDVTGAVPAPGYYVLVANYYQPEKPGKVALSQM
jgi:hypothetical protein